jgi:high-affinity iron transporter
MLRTAHEAGWITIGQQHTVDLSWLAPNGSVQAALITGVLGIPSDPRAIEVLGWFLYLIPVLAYCLWPRSMRPSPAKVPAFQLWLAAALSACAVILAVAVPATSTAAVPPYAQLAGGGTLSAHTAGTGMRAELRRSDLRETLHFGASRRSDSTRAGIAADRWRTQSTASPKDRPRTVTVADLVELEGGRLPVGVNAQMNPGPFTAAWAEHTTTTLWTVDGRLLDAASTSNTVLTISGGGLPTARTFSVPAASDDWRVSSSSASTAATAITAAADAAREALLLKLYLPIGLVIAALILAIRALITQSAGRRAEHDPAVAPAPETTRSTAPQTRSTSYAAK